MAFLECPYQSYYHQQAGGGVGAIYRGAPYQKGHGIGSFLGGLFRSVMPLLKSGARAVGKETLRAGANIIDDMSNNTSLKEAFQNRIHEASENLKRKALQKISAMEGKGLYKRRRLIKSQSINNLKRLRTKSKSDIGDRRIKETDIFSPKSVK